MTQTTLCLLTALGAFSAVLTGCSDDLGPGCSTEGCIGGSNVTVRQAEGGALLVGLYSVTVDDGSAELTSDFEIDQDGRIRDTWTCKADFCIGSDFSRPVSGVLNFLVTYDVVLGPTEFSLSIDYNGASAGSEIFRPNYMKASSYNPECGRFCMVADVEMEIAVPSQ